MNAISYHLAHEPYIEAVARAVQAFGVELADWAASPPAGDNRHGLRSGHLQAAPPLGPDRNQQKGGLLFTWDEEDGWSCGECADHYSGQLIYISYFGGGVLPAPETVADVITRLAAGEDSSSGFFVKRGPRYRAFTDDDGFEAELAAYHPHEAPA
jgi:hypothetical protein